MIENRADYIDYRFQRAEESYEDALILAAKERWNAVVNRLYYASFYAVIALLLKHNVETKSHNGVRQQFGLLFVKQGLVDRKFGKLYSKLFDFRQKGDYGDRFDHEETVVRPLISEVRDFIDVVKALP